MDATEREYAPGIYVRKGGQQRVVRSSGGALGDVLSSNDLAVEPLILLEEEKRLALAVEKLDQSQREMREFDPNGDDPDIVDALQENEEVLEKKRSRLADVRSLLSTVAPCTK